MMTEVNNNCIKKNKTKSRSILYDVVGCVARGEQDTH